MEDADPELYAALKEVARGYKEWKRIQAEEGDSLAIRTAVMMAASLATTRTGPPPVLLVGGSLRALTARIHTK